MLNTMANTLGTTSEQILEKMSTSSETNFSRTVNDITTFQNFGIICFVIFDQRNDYFASYKIQI